MATRRYPKPGEEPSATQVVPGDAPEPSVEDLEELEGQSEPDTHDAPAELDLDAALARRGVTGARAASAARAPQQRKGVPEADCIEVPNVFYTISEPEHTVEADDPLVVVKPRATFDCHIGNRRYYFKKNSPVKVPMSVRDVLLNANQV